MKQKKISIKEMVAAGQFRKEKEYWMSRLSGQVIRSSFPCDPVETSIGTGVVQFRLSTQPHSRLLKLSKGSDQKLHMILTALVVFLLRKYTGNRDIIVGTPIYKQEAEGEFINTVLALRNSVEGGMTFKELLVQVRQTIVEASENQNYPIETLLYHLDIPRDGDDFPLFDVAVLFENIHDKSYIRHLSSNVMFSFLRNRDHIEGQVEYNASLYRPSTVQRIVNHFKAAARESLDNVDLELNRIDILSREEKEQLLYRFNDSRAEFSKDKTIHRLFEEQAVRTPDHIAAVGSDTLGSMYITYCELNAKSTRLAHRLRGRGVGRMPGDIAAIMVRPSIERVVGMMAVLKAGAAYLPLDSNYPGDRIKYMLNDNRAKVLLLEKNSSYGEGEFMTGTPVEIVPAPDEERGYIENPANPDGDAAPGDLAYIMYTSGTTGKPKGVMVEHRNVVNLVHWFSFTYGMEIGTRILGLTDYMFDPSVEDIFGALLYGGVYYACGTELIAFMEDLRLYIDRHRINIIDHIPPVLNQLLSHEKKLTGLKAVISGGEKLEESVKNQITCRGYTLYNNYGPTEVTVDALSAKCSENPPTLGRSIANARCYIFDKDNHLAPVGVPGELCVAGAGVARGYLNNVELTDAKFVDNPCIPGERMYRTGDLAKRLPHGDVDFLGRLDLQLKLRGFRIEPGEIENCLLKRNEIKAAVVAAKEDKTGDKYLCAYIVSEEDPNVTELREYLSNYLADYMVPSYFVRLDRIPLSAGGKTDVKKLPEPEVETGRDYIAPGNEKEEILVRMWSEVLGIEKQVIGIDNNFFELGGHSLKATVLAERIHKTLGVKLQLAQIFKTPTIRELAKFITIAPVKERHTPIEAVEKKEYYPLSSAQKRLFILQQLDEKGTAYNLPVSLPFEGEPDRDKLELTFRQLIRRHESFRTSFEMIEGEPVQKIHDGVEFKLEYYDTRVGENMRPASDFGKDFVRPFNLSEAPLLRAAVRKEGESNYFLMVDMHHIISDGLSAGILKNDFTAFYRNETLPTMRLQYKDFSEWQNRKREAGTLKQQEEYWLKEFEGKLPVLNLPTDLPRPEILTFKGGVLPFEITGEENTVLKKIAVEGGATLFMLYLAAANIFLSKLSGQEDIVVGIPVAGRRHADLEPIIGMFVNTLALRNYPGGGKTAAGFLEEVKKRTLDAFDNQDFQFEDLVDKLLVARDPSRNPLFDFLFTLVTHDDVSTQAGSGNESEKKILDWDHADEGLQDTTSKFDLKIVGVEQKEKVLFVFEYNTELFKKETVERFISYFKNIIASIVENPGIEISGIQMIGKEERDRLMKKMRAREDEQFIDEIKENHRSYVDSRVEFDF